MQYKCLYAKLTVLVVEVLRFSMFILRLRTFVAGRIGRGRDLVLEATSNETWGMFDIGTVDFLAMSFVGESDFWEKDKISVNCNNVLNISEYFQTYRSFDRS